MKIKNKQNFSFLNYFLVYLLVAISGVTYFYHSKNVFFAATFLSGLIFFLKGYKLDKFFFLVNLFILIVEFLQSIYFREFLIESYLGMHLRVFFAYSVVKIIGIKFPEYYTKLIYYFSILSLIFYLFGLIIPGFNEFFVFKISPLLDIGLDSSDSVYETAPNVIIHCFNTYNWPIYRNSGPFWEPGAFGGFLFIALFFNTIKHKKVFQKENTIFILSILTTMSTTAYIALFMFLISYFSMISSKKAIWLIPIVVYIFSLLFVSQDFLQAKLQKNYDDSFITSYGAGTSITRITSALLDLRDVSKYPIFGRGRGFKDTEFSDNSTFKMDVNHRNNGTFNIMAIYGIPIFIIYFFGIYLTFKRYSLLYNYNSRFAFISLSLILLLGMSEGYFLLAFFISLSLLNNYLKVVTK